MSVKPTVNIDPDDVVRYLLYQQFYYGDDRIYGRTKDRSEYIEGAEQAIEEFYSLLTKHINLIDEGMIIPYLNLFNKEIHKIPIEDIGLKYEDYKESMGPELERGIILTVVIGDALSEVQKKCFKASINQIIDYIIEHKILNTIRRGKIKEKIKSLYGSANPNIGMIYGLSFMKFISQKVQNKEIEERCEQLLFKYYDLVIQDLL